ncbi:MAG: response regulator receiver modulated CheB methylesterase [Anaerocolumna sp.]|jgi:two-component system chemotaxis response regulator CheB|nr:response regulator receiver modulated CheB methylesterase [Anaerocolumna sp.]
MQKKVLVVDDSALMRRVLSDIINLDPRFQVSKVATNGLEAFNLLIQEKNSFDAVILDINMPKMNGLELLEQLEKYKVKATIIIVSTVAKEGAAETIRALELGAFDFVTKPDSFFDVKSDNFKNKIIDCLVVATKLEKDSEKELPFSENISSLIAKKETMQQKQPIRIMSETRPRFKSSGTKKLVAIACSTGGPKALQQVIPKLVENIGCSVLVVQHMPEGFTASLANRLNELSHVTVKESADKDILTPGTAYIAKGGSQMRVSTTDRGVSSLSITVEAARNGLKPCADYMFESLIDTDFTDITCVVLTGMGSDGTNGIKQLKQKKNIYVIAQDEASSTVYGMPKVVAQTGLVDEIVPLEQIASAILKNLGVQ